MKLIPRLSLVLVSIMSLVLAVRGWMRTMDEKAHFESDMLRDHVVTARALCAGVAEVWGLDGPRRAKHLIATVSQASPELRFRWLDADGVGAPFSPDEVNRIAAGEPVQKFLTASPSDDLVSYFAVQAGKPTFGVLELRESMRERDEHVRSSVRATVGSVITVVVVFWIVAMVTGRLLVGRPVDALLAHARRIGTGDLATRLEPRGPRELRALADEMNATSEKLAAAQRRAASEAEARVSAVEQLRHADRLATVGKLAAGVAHEIGTPLSVVAGHAQMIADREVLGDAVLESARVIDVQVGRVARIVRQLLDFARRKGPEGGTADALFVATSTVELLAPAARRSGVDLRASGKAGRVSMDEDSLRQVLTNLITNAVHATPEQGTVTVVVEHVRASHPDRPDQVDCVRIDVTDTGGGIPEEARPHIFDPFFTSKPVGEGTGLGLSVVHGIVQDHRGWIAVDTASGRGTTFSVFLPVANEVIA
jgi:signal transduction histidine kinase